MEYKNLSSKKFHAPASSSSDGKIQIILQMQSLNNFVLAYLLGSCFESLRA